MARYHLVTSHDAPGGFTEFTAYDDVDAIAHAEAGLHGGRIVQLTDMTHGRLVRPATGGIHETYVHGPTKSRWHWRCLTCPVKGPEAGFKRRRDADDDANEHEDAMRQEEKNR